MHYGKRKSFSIAHVVHSFGVGGMETGIVKLIAKSMDLFTHQIVCFQRPGENELQVPGGTPVLYLNKPQGRSIHHVFELARLLKRVAPDVIHTRNWSGLDGIVAARLAGLRNVVHGEHGWSIEDPYGNNPRRIFLRRLCSSWVCEYTCVSRQLAEWLKSKVRVRRPITQIYNGVDTDRFKPAVSLQLARSRLNLPIDGYIIGIVGRLDPIKNHAALIRAFFILQSEIPGSILLVVGEGPERTRLEKMASERVIFLGSRNDVPELLQCMDVFVLPSLNEGISNTILEAMATGIPVVATRVGGNPELVRDGVDGTLFEPEDVNGLAAILARYGRETQLRKAHGESGRERVIESFSVEKMVRSYEQVYRRVIAFRTNEVRTRVG